MAHISDMRSKSADELKEAALAIKKELFNLRFQAASGEAVKISRFREGRRDIARIQTVMNDPQQKMTAKSGTAKKAAAKKPVAAKKAAPKKKAAE